MGPDSERRFAELAVQQGHARPEAIRGALAEREQSVRRGKPWQPLPQLLCDRGVMDRATAVRVLAEARRSRSTRPPTRNDAIHATRNDEPSNGPAGRARATLGPGMRLGPYELVSQLGRGGMGVVYRARDGRLRREVALKVLAAGTDEESVEQFLREARASARLRHPGIVVVYGAEVIEGYGVIALELVEGGSLARRLKEKPLGSREGARLVADLALAVEAAHAEGIIHRDLKPANVLLDGQGHPRLTDFGLARDQKASVQHTAAGDILGTPAYMAPEQARGEVDRVGPRTDVYGLGAVLFEILTGEPPFTGRTGIEVLRKVIDEDVPSPTVVRARRGLEPLPADLVTICQKALEKDPTRRFGSAAALASDLGRWLDGRPIEARPASPFERALRAVRRARVAAAVGLAVVLTLGLAAAGSTVFRRWGQRQSVERALAAVARGAVRERFAAREEALLEILKAPSPETARILGETVDAVSAQLRAIRRELLLAVVGPRDEAERGAQAGLDRLADALDAEARLAPGERLEARFAATIRAARQRLIARLRADKHPDAAGHRGLDTWLARRELERVGEDRLEVVSVACEALGRLGIAEGSSEPLARYLFAEDDEARALVAGEALVRLRTPRALWLAKRASERFGVEGRFADRVARAIRELGAEPAFDPKTAEDFRDRGEIRTIFKNEEGALADFTRAIELDPKDAASWEARGSLHAGRNRWEEALVDLERAVELDPTDPRYLCSRAQVRGDAGDAEGAIRDCTRALELDPTNANAWDTRGYVKTTRRIDLAGAIEDFGHAIELDPFFADAFANRGAVRRLLHDYPRALEDLAKAMELDPTRPGFLIERAGVLGEIGRTDDAIADYDRALGIDPRRATAFIRRGQLRSERHDYPHALEDLSKALEIDPKSGEAYAVRALMQLERGDPEAAKRDADQGVATDPRSAIVWANRGILRGKLGDFAGAIDDLTRAIELNPAERGSREWRGYARTQTRDFPGAIDDLTRAIALAPGAGTTVLLRGLAYEGKGDFDEALKDFTRAIQLMPRWADARARRAEAYLAAESFPEAIADATASLEIDPRDRRALETRGAARVRQGELEAGIADLEAAYATFPPGSAEGASLRKVIDRLRSGK